MRPPCLILPATNETGPGPCQQPQAGFVPRAGRSPDPAPARPRVRPRRATAPAELARPPGAAALLRRVSCGAPPAQAAGPVGRPPAPPLGAEDPLRHRRRRDVPQPPGEL